MYTSAIVATPTIIVILERCRSNEMIAGIDSLGGNHSPEKARGVRGLGRAEFSSREDIV